MAGSRLVPRHGRGVERLQDAMRLRIAGGCCGRGRLLAQKSLGRLLHRGGTRYRCVRMDEDAMQCGQEWVSACVRACVGGGRAISYGR
jgi:hypothetical protein